MEQLLTTFNVLTGALRRELHRMHEDQDGYATEAVIITSLLVALAIAAVAIIATKVLTTANGIQTQ